MKQKWDKEGKKIPPTPGFEPQVIQCLVGATFTDVEGALGVVHVMEMVVGDNN